MTVKSDAQIMNMHKFNDIDLKTLFNFLVDTVTDMPVADLLVTERQRVHSHLRGQLLEKIVVETAHNS